MRTRHIFCLLIVLFVSFNVQSQIIVSNPALPTASDSVIITFNATGTPLETYTGTVYSHTGVILEGNPNWQQVIGSWGNNTTQPALTRLSATTYELRIRPSIKAYYGVAETATIQKMAFVFRNAEANAQTTDIFVDVVAAGMTVKITSPTVMQSLFELNDMVTVEVSANGTENLYLYISNTLVDQSTQNVIEYQFNTTTYGSTWIKATGTNGNATLSDSISIFTRSEVVVSELPASVVPGINYTGNNEVTLVLHDPAALKSFAFAIGDHSNWQASNEVYMNRTPDGKHYWVTLTNLEPNREYIYQYWIDGEMRIADPYADKISDPWNDRYISSTNYPNMIEYPNNKTTGMASVFRTTPEEYTWQTTHFEAPDKTDLVIYELHIRDFVESDDIKDVMQKLDYLQDLGINAIELMPINEFEGNDSWGYNPSFYFAPDKAYGTKNDYKRFIDECHARGIAVIIDMVLNHSFGQSPFVQMYFDANAGQYGQPTATNPWYNQTCPHEPWCWGYDFDHSAPVVQNLIDRITTYWMQEFNVDGFRFDFTKGFTNVQTGNQGSNYDAQRISYLKRMADQIWNVNPDAYVILEHLCENSEEKELAEYRASEGKGMLLWGNMNYNYNEATMGWLGNSNFSGVSYKSRGWSVPNLIGYMESHDEERLMYKNLEYGNSSNPDHNVKNLSTALKRCELAAAFFFTIPGPKMIWQFGELGYDVSIDYNGRVGRKPVRWNYANESNRRQLHGTYAKLIHLKRNYPVFTTTNFSNALDGAKKWIKLEHSDMNAVVMGNFNVTAEQFEMTFPTTGKWYEFFTQDSISIDNATQTLSFAPGEYRLYTSKRIIADSVYIVGMSAMDVPEKQTFRVYPNPSSGLITLDFTTSVVESVEVMLLDLTGTLHLQKSFRTLPGINKIDVIIPTSVHDGVYFIQIQSKSIGKQTQRIIVK